MALDSIQPLDDELPLSRVMADQLARAIVDGSIAPGTKLREEELARRFRTSRTPVREALRLLELEALVTFEPRKGVRVSRLTAADASELYLIRGHLGGLAARLAAENASDRDVQRLRELQSELEGALASGDRDHFAHCVIEYDDVIVGIAGNKLLGELLDRLRRQSLRVSIILSLPLALYEESIVLRRQMVDAVAAKEAERAEDAMRRLNQLTWAALAELGLPADHPGDSEITTMGRSEPSREPGA